MKEVEEEMKKREEQKLERAEEKKREEETKIPAVIRGGKEVYP